MGFTSLAQSFFGGRCVDTGYQFKALKINGGEVRLTKVYSNFHPMVRLNGFGSPVEIREIGLGLFRTYHLGQSQVPCYTQLYHGIASDQIRKI